MTSIQIVRTPWAHTPVLVKLGSQEMEKIVKVRKSEQRKNQKWKLKKIHGGKEK